MERRGATGGSVAGTVSDSSVAWLSGAPCIIFSLPFLSPLIPISLWPLPIRSWLVGRVAAQVGGEPVRAGGMEGNETNKRADKQTNKHRRPSAHSHLHTRSRLITPPATTHRTARHRLLRLHLHLHLLASARLCLRTAALRSVAFAMPLYEIMCITTTRATQQQLVNMLGKLAIVVQKGE